MHSRAKSMNEITWHESAIWFFIAHKLLFANQSQKISSNFIRFQNFQNNKKKLKCQKFQNSSQNFHKMPKLKIFIKFQNFQKFQNYSKIEPYVIKQLLHLNLINMRFYGAEYNNIELGFASFNIVVLCSIKPLIDLVQVQ